MKSYQSVAIYFRRRAGKIVDAELCVSEKRLSGTEIDDLFSFQQGARLGSSSPWGDGGLWIVRDGKPIRVVFTNIDSEFNET